MEKVWVPMEVALVDRIAVAAQLTSVDREREKQHSISTAPGSSSGMSCIESLFLSKNYL